MPFRAKREGQESNPVRPNRSQRFAIGVFFERAPLQAALVEIEGNGFDASAVSLLGGETTWQILFGCRPDPAPGRLSSAETPVRVSQSDGQGDLPPSDGRGAPRKIQAGSLCGPVLVSSGPLADLMTNHAAGGAEDLAARLRHWLGTRHAQALARQIDNSGMQIWVRVGDSEAESRACRVLLRYGDGDVQVHDLQEDAAAPKGAS